MYLVTRLDGYTVVDVKGMIDRAIIADSSGNGYWVVDDHPKTGAYLSGDNIDEAYLELEKLGQDIIPNPWEVSSSWITENAAGSVIGYTSWGVHSSMPDGYYSNTLNFNYLPGAISSTYE